jgi:hypothetical protein
MKPILVHSKILNETICLSEVPVEGQVCYSEKEIKFLKASEKNMKPERYADYLRKVHSVKKTFPDSKIEDIKMEAPTSDQPVATPRVEDTEATPGPSAQKSLWED